MTWQIPLFISIIFSTIRGFLEKKLVAKVDPFLTFFYIVLWSTLAFVLFYIFQYQSLPAVYPEMMLLGVLFSISYGSYLMAVKINLSLSAVFASFYFVIPLLLAVIYLGEWQIFNPSTGSGQKIIFGVFLIFISMWLIFSDSTRKNNKDENLNKKWLFFSLVNLILAGVGTFWGKTFIANHGPLETLISQSYGGLPVLFILNIFRGKKFQIGRSNMILTILGGLVAACNVLLFYIAFKSGPITVILPVQTLVLTITIALVGLFVFKEAQNMTRKKIMGMVLGTVGVILLMV